MKKKLLIILLLATISIICAVLFVACNNGNNTKKDETQSNACNITETDQVDIRYNLSETGTLSDENGVYQYIYRFDIRVGCWVGEGINSVTILQN